MPSKESSQKFVGRNRPPRVQIEYEVETYGSMKKVQLPFVVGVMANLSGTPAEALPSFEDRKFLEISMDNFDERLKAAKPRVSFAVKNRLEGNAGEEAGDLSVDITFERMADFSPERIAEKVEPLRKLLQARNELSDLMSYMNGKAEAEKLVAKLLADNDLLEALANAPKKEPTQG